MGLGRSVGGRLTQAVARRGPTGAQGPTGPTYNGPGSAYVNVKNAPFNAAGNNVTDDTAAIQAAYDAVLAAGGGTIYFPPGVYLLSSALRTSHPSDPGVTYNTQIALHGDALGGNSYQTVAFVGPLPASGTSWHPGVGGPGAVIRSNITGSGTQPSAIGCATDSHHALVRLHFENLIIMCAPSLTPSDYNPTLTALDFDNAWGVTLYEVKVTNGDEYPGQNGTTWSGAITATNPAARGIVLPHTWASSPVGMYHVEIIGFYAGLVTGEHLVADDILVFRCKIAVVPEVDDVTAQNFPARIGKLCVSYCQYGIAYATVGAGLTEIPSGSTSHLFVDCYENEQGADAVTLWDIYDPNTGVAGERLVGTVGFGHSPQHHPKVFARTVAWYLRSGTEVQVYSIGDANMVNGWTGSVRVWIDRVGVVHLDGLITGTSGLVAFTLPAPLRPADEAMSSGRYPTINPDTGAYGNLQVDRFGVVTPFGLTKAEFHCQFLSYDRWNSAKRPIANINFFLTNTTPF